MKEFSFTQEALSTWKQTEKIMWKNLVKLSKERALKNNRTIITSFDIEMCVKDAIILTFKELENEY